MRPHGFEERSEGTGRSGIQGLRKADGAALYVAGMYHVFENDMGWRIEKRRLSDLGLANNFGANGVYRLNPSSGEDVACGVALDSQYLYVVGHRESAGNDGILS